MTTPVPHDRRWQVLGVIGIAQLMVVLDVTIVNIALPSAQRDLGFSADDRQWVITAYALAFGGLLLLGGRIADLFGRKRAFIAGPARVRGRVRGRRRGDELRGARRRPRRPGRVRRAARSRRALAADDHVHRPEGAREGVRDLRRDRRHGRRDRPAARRRADRVARLALVPVRLRGLRPAGGGDRRAAAAPRAGREPAAAGRARRAGRLDRPVRAGVRPVAGGDRRLGRPDHDRLPRRVRRAADGLHRAAAPDEAAAAAAAGGLRPRPRGVLPGDRHRQRGSVRPLPVPDLLPAADQGLQRVRDRARVPADEPLDRAHGRA